jgi:hypothetical protein
MALLFFLRPALQALMPKVKQRLPAGALKE